jgi:hypothetical protein
MMDVTSSTGTSRRTVVVEVEDVGLLDLNEDRAGLDVVAEKGPDVLGDLDAVYLAGTDANAAPRRQTRGKRKWRHWPYSR